MDNTIYDNLGDENLQLLVDRFYDLVQQHETINHLFKDDFETIKKKQFMFLSQFLGGPSRYTAVHGHPKMRMRHLPHKIDEDAKNAWLACMRTAVYSLPIEEDFKEALYNCFPHVAEHMKNA